MLYERHLGGSNALYCSCGRQKTTWYHIPCKTFVTPDHIPSTILMALPPGPNRDAVPDRHDLALAGVHVLYCVCSLRMSESPASRMAMVEQRKSLPQAVPSSICKEGKEGCKSAHNVTLQREQVSPSLGWRGRADRHDASAASLSRRKIQCMCK